MSNSPLVTYTKLTKNHSGKRTHAIDTLTIHCYVGQVTAKTGCDYFATTPRQASSNYVVGYDGSIGLSVDEANRSWASSNEVNDQRAVTIEVACDATHPYKVTDKAYDALVKLCADICKRNGIKELKWKADKKLVGKVDQQNMTVHRWFAAKACPGEYLYERHGDIADKVNALLSASPAPVQPEREDEKLQVGDIVLFTGTKHYGSSNGAISKTCKPGKARVTALVSTGKYRAHLVAVTGGNSTVYGWVDTALIVRESATLAVGARVRVNAGAKTYTGGRLSSFVYRNTYDVLQIQGNRVVIGVGKAITAAVNKKDLTVV